CKEPFSNAVAGMRQLGTPNHRPRRGHRLRETPVQSKRKRNEKGKLATKRHRIHKKFLCLFWPIVRISTFVFFEEERGFGPAETEGVRKRVADVGLTRLVGHVIEVAVRIRYFVVDGRRNYAALDN